MQEAGGLIVFEEIRAYISNIMNDEKGDKLYAICRVENPDWVWGSITFSIKWPDWQERRDPFLGDNVVLIKVKPFPRGLRATRAVLDVSMACVG